MKSILCTTNRNKVKEFKNKVLHIDFYTYQDENISFEIEENGTTFEENALIKLKGVLQTYDYLPNKYDLLIAEDSGICVESLNGAPGIYSARYSGEKATDARNNQKLLDELQGIENRNAYYEACIACFYKNQFYTFKGRMHGKIAREEKGKNGFGYDPLFIPDGEEQTLGELNSEFKLKISHRSNAINEMVRQLGLNNL